MGEDGPEAREPARANAPAALDIAAPNWLTQLLKPVRAPIDWKRAFRAALAVAGPIAGGMAFGHLAVGVLVSIGSLCGTVTSVSGPYRDRVRRSGFAVLAGAIGFYLGDLVGGLTGSNPFAVTGLIMLAAVVSAVISAAGNTASLAGLQALVYVTLGTHEVGLVSPPVAAGCFLGGAAWAIVLSIALWPVHPTAPERALVVAVYDNLVAMLAASGTPGAIGARQRLTAALNAAYDALLAARSRLQGRDRVYRQLFTVLSETTPVVEASVALLNTRHRPPRSVLEAIALIGVAIDEHRPPPELDLPETGSPAMLALVDGLRNVADVLANREERGAERRPAPPSPRERIARWLDEVLAGPAAWLHGLRIALCVAVAGVLTDVLPIERSYWVPLTIAIVFKPDFGSVFGRAVLRGGGTFVGALLGAGILALNPNGWVLVILVAVVAFLLPIAQVRNYGMFSTVLTPLVVIQLDLGNVGSWNLVLARLLDTVLGCVIVLVVGYLPWPSARNPKVGGRLADAVDAVAGYAERALGADPRGRSTLRRRTYRQLSDLRTTFQRVIVEPSMAGRQAAAWYPAIVALERLTGAITRVAVEIEHGAPIPDPSDVDTVVTALRGVADAVRAGARPADPPAIESPELANVAGHLGIVGSALRGPDLDSLRPFSVMRRFLRRRA